MNRAFRIARLALVALTACSGAGEVSVQVSAERALAEPALTAFQEKTGVKVTAVYADDAPAKAAAGAGDVLWAKDPWDVEPAVSKRTPLPPPAHASVKDAAGRWAGVAGQPVVFLSRRDRPLALSSLSDLEDPGKPAQGALPAATDPTMRRVLAVLRRQWGAERVRSLLQGAHRNRVRVLPSTAAVRDAVARGDVGFGLMDGATAAAAVKANGALQVTQLDQDLDGAIVVPTVVAAFAGTTHEAQARQLVDFLTSNDAASALGSAGHLPLSPSFRPFPIDYAHLAEDEKTAAEVMPAPPSDSVWTEHRPLVDPGVPPTAPASAPTP